MANAQEALLLHPTSEQTAQDAGRVLMLTKGLTCPHKYKETKPALPGSQSNHHSLCWILHAGPKERRPS